MLTPQRPYGSKVVLERGFGEDESEIPMWFEQTIGPKTISKDSMCSGKDASVFSFYFHFFKSSFFALLLCTLVSCSGSGSGIAGLGDGLGAQGAVPKLLLQTTSGGLLRAQLEVYGADLNLVHEQALEINGNTGEVFGNSFELPRGATYTFVVVFHYSQEPYGELPIAFVAKSLEATEEFLSLSWEAPEVLTSLLQASPDINAAVSGLPLSGLSFDPDGDNYLTFDEIREGSHPLLASSIPEAPLVENVTIHNVAGAVIADVIFRDVSGVSTIQPGPARACGYIDWEVSVLDEQRKRLSFMFNLHSDDDILDGSTLTLPIRVSDTLGLQTTHTISVNGVVKNGAMDIHSYPADLGLPNLDLPNIAILAPTAGQPVSDLVLVEAIACDEEGINTLSLLGIDDVEDNDVSANRFTGVINTLDLGDGQQPITLQATDSIGNTLNTKTVVVDVTNNNPIVVIFPQPGATLQDGFNLILGVDENILPGATNLFVSSVTDTTAEQNEIFGLNLLKFDLNVLGNAFTSQVFDTSGVTNQNFLVHAVAVGPNGEQFTRAIPYRINNYPELINFDVVGQNAPRACITGSRVNVQWQVANIGPEGSVFINDLEVGTSTGTTTSLMGVGNSLHCSTDFVLTATRQSINGNTGVSQDLSITETLELNPLIIDYSQASGIIRPEDAVIMIDAVDPAFSTSGLRWRVRLQRQGEADQLIDVIGDTIDNNDLNLEPFSNYEIQLFLMAPGGEVISQDNTRIFETSDQGLVLWYDFEDTNLAQDSSGQGNDGSANGPTQMMGCPFNSCASFDGTDDHISVPHNDELDPTVNGFTIRLWVNWAPDPVDLSHIAQGVILEKTGQYTLRTTQTHLEFFILDTMGDNQFARFLIDDMNPATEDITPGVWYEVVIVYDPNPLDRSISLEIIDLRSDTTPLTEPMAEDIGNLSFGQGSEFGSSNFSGMLDEVLIYNLPLSVDEFGFAD